MPSSNYSIAEYIFVKNTRLAIIAHPIFFSLLLLSSFGLSNHICTSFIVAKVILLLAILRWYSTSLYLNGHCKPWLRFFSVYGFIPTGLVWGIGGINFLFSGQTDLFILHAITSLSFAAHGIVNFSAIPKVAILNVALLTSPLIYWSLKFSNIYSTIYIAVLIVFALALAFVAHRAFVRDQTKLSDSIAVAKRDPMTGLLNKIEAKKRLNDLLSQGAPLRRVGFSVIDIDHFKQINDKFGHSVGDACIIAVASTLENCIRSASDFGCRYGGEEFILVLTNINELEFKMVSERIRINIEQLKFEHTALSITISSGCVWVDNANGKDLAFSDLFEAADTLLYKAKNQGRNQVCYSSI